jgi:hypothetical protein
MWATLTYNFRKTAQSKRLGKFVQTGLPAKQLQLQANLFQILRFYCVLPNKVAFELSYLCRIAQFYDFRTNSQTCSNFWSRSKS